MQSIKLTVICDQAQGEHVCVQLADTWARVSIARPAPFSASVSIKHLIIRAARMTIAAVGVVDLEAADLIVGLMGYDMCPSDELQEQITEEWLKAIIEAMRYIPSIPIGAASALPALISTPEIRRPSSATEPTTITLGTTAGSAGSAIPVLKVGARITGDIAPQVPPTLPMIGAASNTSALLSRDDRRAKLVRTMVQTVRQYAQTYGAAPDFSSDRPAFISRVHNYIRSVTTRQQASQDVLEAVRLELARTQGPK